MKTITQLTVLDGYRVRLHFDDGVEGEADFSPHIGEGVFAAWNDYSVFQRAGIADQGRVLEWPGDIEFCADALWLQVTRKQPQDLFPSLKQLSIHA